MTRFLISKILWLTLIFVGLMQLSLSATAEEPLPTINIPKSAGSKCIHPESEMRRNHMKYLLHQRDETMHEGIRNQPDSLAKCIDCHIRPNAQGKIPSIESKQHFCHGCHQYAAVQIDCFECHADRPQKYIHRKYDGISASKAAAIARQLQQSLKANSIKNIQHTDGVNQK